MISSMTMVNLTHFTGESQEEDAKKWLLKAENTGIGLTEADKLKILPSRLTSIAEKWQREDGIKCFTYPLWKTAFLERF